MNKPKLTVRHVGDSTASTWEIDALELDYLHNNLIVTYTSDGGRYTRYISLNQVVFWEVNGDATLRPKR